MEFPFINITVYDAPNTPENRTRLRDASSKEIKSWLQPTAPGELFLREKGDRIEVMALVPVKDRGVKVVWVDSLLQLTLKEQFVVERIEF